MKYKSNPNCFLFLHIDNYSNFTTTTKKPKNLKKKITK